MTAPDLEFFFDPSCPFCWITSKWVRLVRDETGIEVRWSFISLVTLNEPYDAENQLMHDWHMGGRRMQRVIAAAAAEHGDDVVGPLYEAIGTQIWESQGPGDHAALAHAMGHGADLPGILRGLELPAELAAAVDDDGWDDELAQSTKEALSRAGDDVGTPIITFDPDGDDAASFFGPVISEVPDAATSVALYEALRTAARVPSFSELKRSKRDQPQLPALEGL